MKQNQYHIENVKQLFPGVPVYSFVVFTSSECDLKVRGEAPDTSICTYYGLVRQVNNVCAGRPHVFTLAQIDGLFNEMKAFSHMVDESVQVSDRKIPFYEYVETLTADFKSSLESGLKKYETGLHQAEKSYERNLKIAKRRVVCCCLGLICLVVVGCLGLIQKYQDDALSDVQAAQQEMLAAKSAAQKAKDELSAFARKFELVEEFQGGEIQVKKDMVLVSDVVLEESADFENTVNFSCLLTWNGDRYYVTIGEHAKIVVFLNDGSIQEYAFWNSTNKFSQTYKLGIGSWYNTKEIDSFVFYNVAVADISYVKLTNLGLRALGHYSNEDLVGGFEIELYSCDGDFS